MTDQTSLAAAARLSDRDLLDATARAAADERRTTAELVALLAELDSRKLYLAEGFSSLFTYCTQRLHLSEFAAYGRITAARTVCRFPSVLSRLAEGTVTLTSIGLLAAHLTDENHEALLDAVQYSSRRDVERLIAGLYGQPDIPASVRRLPEAEEPGNRDLAAVTPVVAVVEEESPMSLGSVAAPTSLVADVPAAAAPPVVAFASPTSPPASTLPLPPGSPTRPQRRDAVAPLAVGRYLLRVTIGAETHARLDKARDLLRHVVPNGDLALILDRALAVLVDQLERRKTGRLSGPSRARGDEAQPRSGRPRGRRISAAVKRDVWARDGGRCAFIGPHGRCHETGLVEYHHVVPYARGGAADAANVQLRCRAHNLYEAEREFGDRTRRS